MSSEPQFRWYEIRRQYALHGVRPVAWQRYVTSGKASHRWWVCNKLYHAENCFKQGASKIVKISQQMAKLCWKLKCLLFFWDKVY